MREVGGNSPNSDGDVWRAQEPAEGFRHSSAPPPPSLFVVVIRQNLPAVGYGRERKDACPGLDSFEGLAAPLTTSRQEAPDLPLRTCSPVAGRHASTRTDGAPSARRTSPA
eukprot:210360-Hanusia_phi.AAC.5